MLVESGSGLGVLRSEGQSRFAAPVPVSQLDDGVRDLVERGAVLIINKTNVESTVHCRVRMDYIGVKKLRPDGTTLGEHRFVDNALRCRPPAHQLLRALAVSAAQPNPSYW